MTDFFSRLAERALGLATTIQPMVAPLYAPEPQQATDSMLEMLADETQEVHSPVPTTSLPTVQHTQIRASLAEAPHAQSSIFPHDIATKSAQAGTKPLPMHAPLTLEKETQTMLQLYPALQRAAQTHDAITEQHTHTTTQNIHTNTHTTSYMSVQNVSQAIEQSERYLATAEPIQTSDKREALATGTHTIQERQETVDNGASGSIYAASRQFEPYDQHIHRMEEAQVTPTIQVTIGRIEVRATTTPAQSTQPQRQQVASPVMSLDDYLHQRAKGGR
jgi:hypothetical protein